MVLDQGDQPLRIGHVRLGGHDQAGTATERQEQVEHRDVEGQGGDGQQRIVGLHAWRTRHRVQQVDDAAMRYLDALGHASRAGGVDHIGHGRGADLGVGRRPLRQFRHLVDAQGENRGGRQGRTHAGVGEHGHRCAVLQHVGDALARVGRVQRHIGRAGLEDGQDPDQHVQATVDADRHAIVRPDALVDEVVGQSVGLRVEVGVAQCLLREDCSDRLGRTLRLGFEQLMNVPFGCQGSGGRVEAMQHARALVAAQQGHGGDRLRRIGEHALQQGQQLRPDAFDGGALEQVERVLQIALERVAAIVQPQRQVELRGSTSVRHRRNGQLRQLQMLVGR
ncbi:hypothetical protein NB710_002530 [Xanthomonas sacchari]|nr:hypothetical protein [Xanthomonas sacchari]